MNTRGEQNMLDALADHERRAVLNLFFSVTRRELTALALAIGCEDFHEVRRLAHRVRGSAAIVGASGVATLAATLERTLGSADRAARLLAELQEAFRHFGNLDAMPNASGIPQTPTARLARKRS